MAADSDQVVSFIEAAKARGVADEFIVTLLKQNGWSERRIFGAFSSYYTEVLGVAPPSRSGRVENARDAFFYLLTFTTLGFWTIALGSLFYALIDRWFPDAGNAGAYAYWSRNELATQLAALIVTFPLFLFVSRLITSDVRNRPDRIDSGIRKWLTYVALVVTAIIMLGDGIWFLDAFLRGELTVRFVLKALVLLVIAGGIFSYYLGAVRAEATQIGRDRVFAGLSVAAVALGLVLGFGDFGSPVQARMRLLDERRVSDLRTIAANIKESWRTQPAAHRALPKTLEDVMLQGGTTDPETARPYTYLPGGGGAFKLCTTFDLGSDSGGSKFWKHDAGLHCFSFDPATSPETVYPY